MQIVSTAVDARTAQVTSCRLRRVSGLTVALTMLVCGCGDSGPVPIAAPTPPTPPPTTLTRTFAAVVYDTVSRPVAGAAVEVVDGPAAGLTATTDDRGHLSLNGTFAIGIITFRVSKDGYETATMRMNVPSNPGPTFTFTLTLRSLASPIDLAGNYALTFRADAACSGNLPPEVRARTFTATVAPASTLVDGFAVTLAESSLITNAPLFLAVSGDYVNMWIDPEFGSGVTERLAQDTYFQLMGFATGQARSSATWTIPFNGVFDYCEVAPTNMSVFLCGTSNPTWRTCSSTQHELVFAKR